MTILSLNVPQRVNIVAMLDAVECHGRREAWATCRLQEQFSLSDAEKQAIGWRTVVQDGREYATWNNAASATESRNYELSDDDMQRLVRAIDQFRMVPGRDRLWYEPLVAQLPEQSVNGAAR
jgi:hypothetical protein